jgi:hypothetical protein
MIPCLIWNASKIWRYRLSSSLLHNFLWFCCFLCPQSKHIPHHFATNTFTVRTSFKQNAKFNTHTKLDKIKSEDTDYQVPYYIIFSSSVISSVPSLNTYLSNLPTNTFTVRSSFKENAKFNTHMKLDKIKSEDTDCQVPYYIIFSSSVIFSVPSLNTYLSILLQIPLQYGLPLKKRQV